jgi:Tol biopolymer transport system component
MKSKRPWFTFALLALLVLSMQGCLGFGGSTPSNSTSITQNSSGKQVTVTQNLFKGKIYLTIDHNLWVITGDNKATELLKSGNIYDPAISPDGKWIAYVVMYKNWSDLMVMPSSGPATGSSQRLMEDGNGKFYIDSGLPKDTFHWFWQPAWSPDGTHILFLSDLQKDFVWANLNSLFSSGYFLDLQVFSIPFNNPAATPQVLAYASFGDGGDRDPAYQPAHPGSSQIVYTHYAYDEQTGTQQVIQIFMADANAITDHPGTYTPVVDSGVALTPTDAQNIQPAFSPDGNAIVYVRRESATSMGLYIMATPEGVTANPNDPATRTQALLPYKSSSHLLSSQYVSQPIWSPDGKQIAFLEYTNSEFDLWLVNVSYNAQMGQYKIQGTPTQLTTGGVDGSSRPSWTT